MTEEEINALQIAYKTLERKHNASLKRHSYPKFGGNSPGGYIIDYGFEAKDGITRDKFGIFGYANKSKCANCQCESCLAADEAKSTFDSRLQSHRTTMPQARVNFLYQAIV